MTKTLFYIRDTIHQNYKEAMMQPFPGFPRALFTFLTELARNNNKEWFNDNKARYQDDVVKPVTEFVKAMGERLPRISNCFIADPRPHGGSMFRIYRDTRFSKDKRPYRKTWAASSGISWAKAPMPRAFTSTWNRAVCSTGAESGNPTIRR